VPLPTPGAAAAGRAVRAGGQPGRGLARRLALPKAAEGCTPGYALLDGDSHVRYRTYDPGWPAHDQEQEILLEAIESGHTG
jgi:hypothetical protein